MQHEGNGKNPENVRKEAKKEDPEEDENSPTQSWSKREKQQLIRILMAYGLPRDQGAVRGFKRISSFSVIVLFK